VLSLKFKVQKIYIATGGTFVAIMNKLDAHRLDWHTGDRIGISIGGRKTVAVLDITASAKVVKPESIGLMEDVADVLHVKTAAEVHVSLEEKPHSLSIIKKKLDGKTLTADELHTVIQDIVDNKLTSIEITYFVAAGYVRGFTLDETVDMTKAMINTGEVFKPNKHPVIDKHCIGGVPGNRTTMVVVPMLIAAGYCVPKTSSRSITSPAGTADTMEVLAKVDLPIERIKVVVDKCGGCMTWGGAVNLAPADDKIITVEHPLSVDAEGQLLASIMAKKGSMSSTHIIIDIPVGKGAKIEKLTQAWHLGRQFKRVGKRLGMKMQVMITDGSQPIGNGIGPALEARDVLYVLQNHPSAPKDLKEKSIVVAAEVFKKFPLNNAHKGKELEYEENLSIQVKRGT
jgi:putative thymidine phosphorylase